MIYVIFIELSKPLAWVILIENRTGTLKVLKIRYKILFLRLLVRCGIVYSFRTQQKQFQQNRFYYKISIII